MGTTGQSITLANSIIGVGILAMPFCFQQCGVLLATLILMCMGLMSRLCCYFLLKSAIITRRRNFEFLAFHIFGPAGKMAVETGIIGFLMGTCIAYFVVVGDLGPQIIAKMLNINQSDILRTSIMVIVSLVCILPLGLLRNVDSLSNVSAATIAFYFCLVIKVIAEATSQLLTTDWYNHMELWKPSGVLQCVPIFSMALFCQTQLFEIFESMPSVSLEKMCLVTKNAINICAAVYLTLGLFGYIAFNSQEISGNILMSLSPTWASDVIKLGFVMSLAFSFPLIIFPCRASLYSFLYRKAHPSQHDHQMPVTTFRVITVGIVGAALVVSLLLPNVELVLGLLGSTVGVLVCVVFPAACFLNVTFKDTNERLLAKFVVVLGLFILVLGTFANLQAAENTRDKYDDRHITKERIDKIVEDFFNHQQESEAALKKPNIEVPKPEINKIVKPEIIKDSDSEVQPPNPVPPEAQPDPGLKLLEEKDEKPKEILPNTKEEILNRETESHPRNLKLKTNGQSVDEIIKVPNEIKEANGEVESNIDNKQDKISSQEKIDMLKQQQLVETIKQHGEEQKELLNEQKNILKEILKTKQELENKKEEENNEAKKIAVESIQKIANMAIQSIGGVTEKPDKKPDPIQNIADAAVNEIAKKAAETLNAIKQKDNSPNIVKQPDTISNGENKVIKKLDEENKKSDPLNIEKPAQKQNIGIEKEKSNILTNQETNKVILDKVNKVLNDIKLKKEKVAKNEINSKTEEKELVEPLVDNKSDVKIKDNLTPMEKTKSKEKIEINPKAPIPLIMNPQDNFNKEVPNNKIADSAKPRENKIKNVGDDTNKIVDRQKREVVDCTETTRLQPEDKQICENLVNKPIKDATSDILPKVDLNDALNNKIPLDILSVHHIRSLKSFAEDKKR
ncbi:putative sodium-coupled neutral amino acid transporter 10 [Aricia agestis]|uniref:putative sodium-coupled neutral amino acid transporter 10 n=1 Tax=Aricia agestis TaxID=91739 RepID=UPI001C208F19|nr:putative sodium-coupled neutral amino acid transporter 10 [Aricia agestis]